MIGYHTKSRSNVNWSVGNIDGKIYTKMRACGGKKKWCSPLIGCHRADTRTLCRPRNL
jgi:hypothetical protein